MKKPNKVYVTENMVNVSPPDLINFMNVSIEHQNRDSTELMHKLKEVNDKIKILPISQDIGPNLYVKRANRYSNKSKNCDIPKNWQKCSIPYFGSCIKDKIEKFTKDHEFTIEPDEYSMGSYKGYKGINEKSVELPNIELRPRGDIEFNRASKASCSKVLMGSSPIFKRSKVSRDDSDY